MPTTFSFDEAQAQPKTFSFEEASRAPAAVAELPDTTPFGGRGTTSAPQLQAPRTEKTQFSDTTLGSLVRGAVRETEAAAGKAVAAVGNIPAQVYNTGSAMTHAYPPMKEPFQPGQPLTSPAFGDALEGAINETFTPNHPEPVVQGLAKSVRKAVEGFTTPESIATLPLFEFRAGRVALAGMMAASTPSQIAETHRVLTDPKATTTQKWEALGDAGIQLAMTTALALGVKPEEVKSTLSPEEAARKAQSLTAYTDQSLAESKAKLTRAVDKAPFTFEQASEPTPTTTRTPPTASQPAAETAAPAPPVASESPDKTVSRQFSRQQWSYHKTAPDVLDAIHDLGGVASASQQKFVRGEYDAYNQAFSTGMATRLRKAEGGLPPDKLLEGLKSVGHHFDTLDEMYQAVEQAAKARQGAGDIAKGEARELRHDQERHEDFRAGVVGGAEAEGKPKVAGDVLSEGSTFTFQGEHFTVKEYDPESETYVVQDGRRFGRQYLHADESFHPDPGSVTGESSAEFVPEEPKGPKLAAGVNQGDLLASTQSEPLALVGERGTDGDRVTAEKAKSEQTKVEAAEIERKQQTGLVGMGGAVPAEFERSPQTPTGIKNATVDMERAKRGLPAAIQPAREAFGEVWDATMARIDQDPGWQDRLLEELREKPRALSSDEDAALLHRQIDLQNDYGKATRDHAQAFDDGNEEMMREARLRTARLSDQLLDLYNIGKQAGTETGRGLNARKMMAYEDFSLAQMELSKRSANGGRALTDAERAELTQLHQKIEETQKAYDDYRAATQERISKMESEAAINRIKAEATNQPKIHPAILEQAKKIVAKIHAEADKSRAILKSRLGRTSAGIDPTTLYHLSVVGADHLATAALNLAEWSQKMAQDLGENWDALKEHAQAIYDASEQRLQDATKDNLEAAREMRRKTPEEQIAANDAKIGEKVKAGKKDEIAWYVQRIARLLVQSGVTDREALIDRVHGIMQKHLPGITRREAMDAISGYGDFKQLSKDQISLKLRGMKGEMQQLSKLEDMAKGEPPLKSGVERRTPTEAERKLIKLVNESKFRFQVPITDPATQLKSALDTFKTNLKNRTADLQDKIDRGDYQKSPKRELQLDQEAMRLKAENERVKQKFRQGLNRDRMKQRTPWEKTMDTLVKWRRGFILSGPVTLAKLTSAAIARGIITPLEEGVGAGIGAVFPKLAERAPREGGFNTRAEAKAITEGFTTGMRDAWATLTTGKSPLDLTFGKDPGLPQSFIDIFGNVHGALKAPVKRAEFARSFEKRATAYAKQGVDITDEFVQTRIGLEAYQDAQKAIFMQKNLLNDMYKRALNAADQPRKGEAHPRVAAKVTGTTARVLLPIVKVPLNIVAETMQYAIGSVTGSARLAKAYHDGIASLKPEEGDLIMRQLKKGSLGAAVMLLGFLNPQVLGGFYQQGQKRDKKDVPPDAARVEGRNIPAYVIHNPWMSAAQIGATVRRVSDSKLRKKDKETQGLSHGALAGAFGLAEATPFVREMLETAKAFSPAQRDRWGGELAKSLVVPQGMASIAQYLDQNDKGEPVKRDPKNPLQAVETGIPGLRQNVPVKK